MSDSVNRTPFGWQSPEDTSLSERGGLFAAAPRADKVLTNKLPPVRPKQEHTRPPTELVKAPRQGPTEGQCSHGLCLPESLGTKRLNIWSSWGRKEAIHAR